MANEERSHVTAQAAEDRAFQGSEARYRDRNAAVVAFTAAVSNEIDAFGRFEREYPNMAPADLQDDYDFMELNTAYAQLVVLASQEVVTATETLRDAVYSCFLGSDDCWPKYRTALRDFHEAARLMLN